MITTISAKNLDEAQALLREIATKLAPELTRAADISMRLLVAGLTVEPPPPAGSRYVRTGAQSSVWRAMQPGLTGIGGFGLINATEAARWTESDDQAWMHVGRWQTARQVVAANLDAILAAYDAAVQQAAAR